MECYRCGKNNKMERLYDAISREGLVKVCAKCAQNEELPVVKKPTTQQLKESERKKSINERLYDVAGLSKSNNEIKVATPNKDISLRDIIDRNFEEKNKDISKTPRPDLVENFHWKIMRAIRKKHLTTSQVAREIGESEIAIKMAEKGKMPEDDKKLINKLESFLGIKISKFNNNQKKELGFDPATTKKTTIADLKQLKEKKEEEKKIPKDDKEEIFNEVYNNLENERNKKKEKTSRLKKIFKKFHKKNKEKDYTDEWKINPEIGRTEKEGPSEKDNAIPLEENFTLNEEQELDKKDKEQKELDEEQESRKESDKKDKEQKELDEKEINDIIFGNKK